MKLAIKNPTERFLEARALGRIPELLKSLQAKNVLLLTGEKSFRLSPYHTELTGSLTHFKLIESKPVAKEPKLSLLPELISAYRGKNIDAVIAVGGGSVLDSAKIVALLLAQDDASYKRCLERLETNRSFEKPPLPLIAVPTTSGTGSEVTQYASFENDNRQKISIEHEFLFPRYAVLDPRLLVSMPQAVTASTGFDALSQSIESFWSVNHNPSADEHALRAVPLIMRSFEKVIQKPNDVEARIDMALAASEAGCAIAQTKTTAVHSVSYPITTLFGVPHGHACALTLSSFIRFNDEAIEEKRGNMLWKAVGADSAEDAAQKVEQLMKSIGLEGRLSRLGIDHQGIDAIVENGFRPDRVRNNPRILTMGELREILLKILK